MAGDATIWGPAYQDSTLSPQGANAVALQKLNVAEKSMDLADRQKLSQFWQQQTSGGTGAPAAGTTPPPAPGQGQPSVPPPSFSAKLMSTGEKMLETGLAKPGLEMISKGVEMAGHEATLATQQARQLTYQLQAQKYYAQDLGAKAGAVTDQQSYDVFRQWAEANNRAPKGALPELYHDAVPMLNQAKTGALTYAQQAELKLKEIDERSKEADRRSAIAHRAYLDNLNNFRKKEEIRIDVAQEKANGKPVGAPSKQEVTQAAGMLKNSLFPDFSISDDPDSVALGQTIDTGARAIASAARRIMQDNRGLNYDQALQQALTKSVKDGDWEVVKKAAGAFSKAKTSATFNNEGKDPQTAALLPPDRGQWKAGRWYVNAKGQTAKWTGDGFELYAAPAGGTGSGGETGTADDEDDE